MPFPQLGVLGLLADDGILHDGVAEVIDDRGDGKNSARRSYRLFSGTVCLSCARALFAAINTVMGAAVSASPATTLRLVIEVETVCDMATSLARIPDRVEAE